MLQGSGVALTLASARFRVVDELDAATGAMAVVLIALPGAAGTAFSSDENAPRPVR
jgi:hypothetical protein